MKVYGNLFESITSTEALFNAWNAFKQGKRNKPDIAAFERNLEQEVFKLSDNLRRKTYSHGPYRGFWIRDPKVRRIHKASVRDRVLHHSIFNVLNPIFEPTFIPTSFSCRVGKGTHKGVEALAKMLRAVSKNATRPCFVLKCDIRKFFDSVDQEILLSTLAKKIRDTQALWLIEDIINSHAASLRERERESKEPGKKGIPIGNLTSQLFANVYMNEFDQFVKHELRVKYYIRYTDDFVIVSESQKYLTGLLSKIDTFLATHLRLELHPNKIHIRKFRQGIDFLGYVALPHYTLVRTKTRRRMYKKMRKRVKKFNAGYVDEDTIRASFNSYLGVLSHADSHERTQDFKNHFCFWVDER